MKKALRGLSGIKVFPITEDTETNYKVGEPISIPYAQKLTREVKSSNEKIYADDEVYDDEEVFDGEDFDLEIPEADLKLMEVFEGGKFDTESGEYSWGPDDKGKDYAMNFKAKRKDGNYRMFRYYKAKFKKVKQDLQTQDNGTQVATLTISGTFYKRALLTDPKVRIIKDSTKVADLTWLDTIPTVPDSTEEDLTKLTKDQLLAKATELGITTVSNSNNKDEIIAAIEAKLAE